MPGSGRAALVAGALSVPGLDHRQRPGLERRAARAWHQDDLVRRLEDLAQRERRGFENFLVEAPVVLDRGRLIHGLDHRERQLGRPGDHEHRTRVALGPVDRHQRLLCSGCLEIGAYRWWPETGASRLRHARTARITARRGSDTPAYPGSHADL